MAGLAAFLSVFSTSVVVALIVFGIFCVLRRMRASFYSPATHRRGTSSGGEGRLSPLGDSYLSWVRTLMSLSEDDVLALGGVDAFVFVRFMKLSVRFFAFLSIVAIAVLLPLNQKGQNDLSDIDSLSMANIERRSDLMWAHVCCMWVFSVLLYVLLYREYETITLRAQDARMERRTKRSAKGGGGSVIMPKAASSLSLSHQPPGLHASLLATGAEDVADNTEAVLEAVRRRRPPAQKPGVYSVLVTDIPLDHQSDEDLFAYFEFIYPGRVHSAGMVRDLTALEELVALRRSMEAGLDHANGVFDATGQRPRHVPSLIKGLPVPGIPLLKEEVDSIEFYQNEVRRLNDEIAAEREKGDHVPCSSGFVSFTSSLVATQAAQAWLNNSGWEVHSAPEPHDVFWPNMGISANERELRSKLVSVAIFFLIIFWTIPVAAVASLTTLEELQKVLPFIKSIVDSSVVVRGIIVGLLPTLGLTILMALLPPVLLKLSAYEGLLSYSELDRAVTDKLYYFHVVNTFLVTTIAGSIFASLDEILHQPAHILPMLGKSLPKVSTFFTSYIVLNALGSFPLEILRPGPLLGSIFSLKLAVTWKERRDAEDPGELQYLYVYPLLLLVFTIALSFAVIAPLILPFATGYFALGYLTWLHQIMYVYEHRYESGGRMWPLLFSRVVIGLIIAQTTVIGVVSIKEGYKQGPVLFPLPIISALFYFYCHRKFEKAVLHLPLRLAAQLDENTGVRDKSASLLAKQPGWKFLQGAYQQPALVDEGLLAEIQRERADELKQGHGGGDDDAAAGDEETGDGFVDYRNIAYDPPSVSVSGADQVELDEQKQ